jgi:hypothetical protein
MFWGLGFLYLEHWFTNWAFWILLATLSGKLISRIITKQTGREVPFFIDTTRRWAWRKGLDLPSAVDRSIQLIKGRKDPRQYYKYRTMSAYDKFLDKESARQDQEDLERLPEEVRALDAMEAPTAAESAVEASEPELTPEEEAEVVRAQDNTAKLLSRLQDLTNISI